LVFLENCPDDLARYYDGEYHGSPTRTDVEGAAPLYEDQIALVRQYAESGRLVEIGPAFGLFAVLARDAGFDVTAIEMDATCCAFLRDELQVGAICSDRPDEVLSTLPESRVVALWQVLEHLAHPWACLEAAAKNLAVGGIMVIATPNPEALGFRVLRGHWPHVDAPRHLWLVPAGLLAGMMNEHGLSLEVLRSDDADAKRWNRFAWERYLTNVAPKGERAQRIAARVGSRVAAVAGPLEARGMNGSTYTAVFRKRPV
jgi:Methyltransferase domain